MSRVKISLMCCLAVFAIATAAGVSQASAAPHWDIGIACEEDPTNKSHWEGMAFAFCVGFKFAAAHKWGYKFTNHPSGASVPSSFKETFTDSGLGTSVTCSGTGEGTIGPEAADKQTKLTVSSCTTVKGTCGTPMAEAIHLPWNTELFEPVSEEVRDRFSSSGGLPGWKVTCTILGIKVIDTCEGETNAKIVNGQGKVEATFDAKSPRVKCSMGGAEAGIIEGPETIGPISSSEAVFVE